MVLLSRQRALRTGEAWCLYGRGRGAAARISTCRWVRLPIASPFRYTVHRSQCFTATRRRFLEADSAQSLVFQRQTLIGVASSRRRWQRSRGDSNFLPNSFRAERENVSRFSRRPISLSFAEPKQAVTLH